VTFGAASLSGLTPMHPQWDLPLAGFEKVPAPYWFGAKEAGYGDIAPAEFGLLIAKKLEEKIQELGADSVASFSAEPVQGAGGVIFPPSTYWHEVQRICAKYDVLLHLDEVITGFGRTGEWFGCAKYGFEPDSVSLAKGLSSAYLPVSAVLLSPELTDVIEREAKRRNVLGHGLTYGGHPVTTAVALKAIEIYQRRDIVGHVRHVAPAFLGRLKKLEEHPLVGEARGVGLIAGLELVADKKTKMHFPADRQVAQVAVNFAEAEGLIVRPLPTDRIAICPPLIISEAEIDELFDRLTRALDATADWAKREKLF
jgi:4-aminobutyrate--pyruvate transaminase